MASLLVVAIGHAMTPPRALPCEKIHPFHLHRYFCVVTLAYRGVDADNPGVEVIHRGRIKSMSKAERKQLKRRQAIGPVIGHTKHDNRMIPCHLNGSTGDALHAISCAAGYNIRWLMRAIQRLSLKGLFALAFIVATLLMAGPIRALRAR